MAIAANNILFASMAEGDSWSVEPIENLKRTATKDLRPNWTRHPELGTVGFDRALSQHSFVSSFFFTVDFGDLLAAPSYGATSMMESLKKSVAPEENCLRSRVSLNT